MLTAVYAQQNIRMKSGYKHYHGMKVVKDTTKLKRLQHKPTGYIDPLYNKMLCAFSSGWDQ